MILISPVPAAQGREPVFPADPSLGELQPLQQYPSHLPPKHVVRTASRFFWGCRAGGESPGPAEMRLGGLQRELRWCSDAVVWGHRAPRKKSHLALSCFPEFILVSLVFFCCWLVGLFVVFF